MLRELTLKLTREDERELAHLCAALGFPPEAAAIYAIRLVSACVREGLLTDMPGSAWPEEARLPGVFDEAPGRVLAFERNARDEDARA